MKHFHLLLVVDFKSAAHYHSLKKRWFLFFLCIPSFCFKKRITSLLLNYHIKIKKNMKTNLKTFYYAFSILAMASITFYSCAPAATEDTAATEEPSSRTYKISDNETENIALATEYLNSLIAADGAVTKGLVSDSFMGFGPAAGDSANIEKVIEQWAANNASRTNQESGLFVTNSLTVTEGPLLGDWVSMWGTYTANDNKTSMDITVPWHTVAKIENGKITRTQSWFDNLAPAMALGSVVPAK
jgi:hypothetical protein